MRPLVNLVYGCNSPVAPSMARLLAEISAARFESPRNGRSTLTAARNAFCISDSKLPLLQMDVGCSGSRRLAWKYYPWPSQFSLTPCVGEPSLLVIAILRIECFWPGIFCPISSIGYGIRSRLAMTCGSGALARKFPAPPFRLSTSSVGPLVFSERMV